MNYKIKPIRTYAEYLQTEEERIYITADALIEECEANEGGYEADRERVLTPMMYEWKGAKERLAESTLFNSLSKFEIEIDNIKEPGANFAKDGVFKWFSNTYPRIQPAFTKDENYDRLLAEQALQLPSEGTVVRTKEADESSSEIDILVRKVLYLLSKSGYNELIRNGKRTAIEENVITPFLAPEYTLAVYKILYQTGLLDENNGYEDRYTYGYLDVETTSVLNTFDRAYSQLETLCVNTIDDETLTSLNEDVAILDVGELYPEVLRANYATEESIASPGWRFSAELDDEGQVVALWWQGVRRGVRVADGKFLGFCKSVNELNVDIALVNDIYTKMISALAEFTATEIRGKMQPFFDNALDNIHDDKVVLVSYNEELPLESDEMVHFQRNVLNFIEVASEEVNYLIWLSANPASGRIFELPLVNIESTLVEKLNRASTLNKQLQMLLRDFLQQKWSALSGFQGEHNKDFHYVPHYTIDYTHYRTSLEHLPENYQELRDARLETLRQSEVWKEMRAAIKEGTQEAARTVLSVIKRKKVLQQSYLFREVNDCLKIKNASRYLLPKKSTWVVSLEVPDILTASMNSNDWSSCHAGSYSNSPMVYGANDTTFIVYQKGSKDTYIGPDISVDSKATRAYVHYAYNSQGGTFVFEDAYPGSNRVVTEILPLIFAEIVGIESKSVEPFQFDPDDVADMIITGYFDSLESDTSVKIGDFNMYPCDVFTVIVPPFSEEGYSEGWYYGDYGCVDAYANW